MRFSIFGTKIYISFFFCVFLSVMLLQDKTLVALPLFCAIVAHELSHLTVMFLLGVSPKEISFSPYGIEIVGTKCKSINKEIIVALAGPLINMLIAFVLFLYYKTYSQQAELMWCLVWAFIGLFNLLPSYALDGGTILFNFCLKHMSVDKSELVLKIASFLTALILTFVGIYFIFINFNPSVLVVGLYLFIITMIKN